MFEYTHICLLKIVQLFAIKRISISSAEVRRAPFLQPFNIFLKNKMNKSGIKISAKLFKSVYQNVITIKHKHM